MHTHPHHHHPAPPPLRLDGVEIPAAEIAAEMQHHPAETAEAAWHQAAEALVIRRLLLAEAARQGLDPAPEGEETPEDALLRCLLATELHVPEADEATCRRWFDANPRRFRTRDAWQAEHLLIAADPADQDARTRARVKVEAALATVLAEPGRLAGLAAALSDCPSREQGGDLGLVEEGSTVPAFEAALRATPPGTVHPAAVETRYGFHVLRVLHHAPAAALPFDAVRDRIAAWLTESAWRRGAQQYVAILAGRAAIEGIVLSRAADGPLVQ